MKIKTVTFQYNGINIAFSRNCDNDVMINATEMAKAFSKTPKDWLRTSQAKEYIDAVAGGQMCLPTDLVVVENGGDNYGTWMNQRIALRFAQWINIGFALWVDNRIIELITSGVTAINPEDLLNPDMMIKAMEELKASRAREAEANKKLEIQKPKVECFEEFIDSTGLMSLGEAAKVLGLGRNAMMSNLRDLKILMKNFNGNSVPYQQFIKSGYFEVKKTTRNNHSVTTALVTPRGLEYIKKRLA